MRDVPSTLDAKWLGGIALSVLATACITVSNKDLLARAGGAWHFAGPGMLLLLHRIVSYASLRLTYVCSCAEMPKTPNIPIHLLIIGSLFSNASICTSFAVLREASVTFHQISRLIILPMSAMVDYVLYGKKRTILDYSGILLISYGVAIGLHGEISATPLAVGLSVLSAVSTLASSALASHVLKNTEGSIREIVIVSMKYEIAMALSLVIAFHLAGLRSAAQSTPSRPVDFDPWLLLPLCLNCFLAASVTYLTTWSQGVTSNMLYAVLGQAKMLTTVSLDALLFHTLLSIRTQTGLAIVVTVAVGLTLSDPKKGAAPEGEGEEQRSRAERRRWAAGALLFGTAFALILGDAAVYGRATIMSRGSVSISNGHGATPSLASRPVGPSDFIKSRKGDTAKTQHHEDGTAKGSRSRKQNANMGGTPRGTIPALRTTANRMHHHHANSSAQANAHKRSKLPLVDDASAIKGMMQHGRHAGLVRNASRAVT